jgi:hypothetical protein
MFVACDVTRDADLQRLIDQTLARLTRGAALTGPAGSSLCETFPTEPAASRDGKAPRPTLLQSIGGRSCPFGPIPSA